MNLRKFYYPYERNFLPSVVVVFSWTINDMINFFHYFSTAKKTDWGTVKKKGNRKLKKNDWDARRREKGLLKKREPRNQQCCSFFSFTERKKLLEDFFYTLLKHLLQPVPCSFANLVPTQLKKKRTVSEECPRRRQEVKK